MIQQADIIEQARKYGICADGFKRICEGDIDSMINYYLEMPDWCMERNFPDIDTLREVFKDNSEEKGVYVGRTFNGELLNERQVYVFHNCRGHIRVGLNVQKQLLPMLYVCNHSRLRIIGVGDTPPRHNSERSVIPIYVFGKNDIQAKNNYYVEFKHYKTEVG